jgi:hypothetical protein
VRRVIDGAEIAVFSYRQGESVHRVAYELVADNGRTGHGFSLGRSGNSAVVNTGLELPSPQLLMNRYCSIVLGATLP